MSGPLFNHSLLSQIASLLDGDDDDDSLEHSPLAVSEHPPIVSYTLRYVSLFIVRYLMYILLSCPTQRFGRSTVQEHFTGELLNHYQLQDRFLLVRPGRARQVVYCGLGGVLFIEEE